MSHELGLKFLLLLYELVMSLYSGLDALTLKARNAFALSIDSKTEVTTLQLFVAELKRIDFLLLYYVFVFNHLVDF